MYAFFYSTSTLAFDIFTQEGVCPQETQNSTECDDIKQGNNLFSTESNGKKDVKSLRPKKELQDSYNNPPSPLKEKANDELPSHAQTASTKIGKTVMYFFWGDGCPHCKVEKIFLDEMKKTYPNIEIRDYEVWYNKENANLLVQMAQVYHIQSSGVPVTFIGKHAFVGFSQQSKEEITEAIQGCLSIKCIDPYSVITGKVPISPMDEVKSSEEMSGEPENLECQEKSKTVFVPWIGKLDASEMSLPIMTIVIAGLDSFNPCAFFVLFSLLGLLIHARSRGKMLLIGSVFVFFSGFIYFLFMAAWLNLFLIMGQVAIITKIAGTIAILIAAINIKDYFVFKKGPSLTIPERAKPKLFDRMRKLLKSASLLSILVGTAILAIAANSYELLCTAGFPMVFTRILTLNELSKLTYYFYLILYNMVYVVPLAIIVIIFTITLGKKTLTERQARILKLISGTMMLGLGGILLLNPAILNSAIISIILLSGSLVTSSLIILLTKKWYI